MSLWTISHNFLILRLKLADRRRISHPTTCLQTQHWLQEKMLITEKHLTLQEHINELWEWGSSHNVLQRLHPLPLKPNPISRHPMDVDRKRSTTVCTQISLNHSSTTWRLRKKGACFHCRSPVICLMNVCFDSTPLPPHPPRQLQVKGRLQEVVEEVWWRRGGRNLKKNSQRNRRRRELGRQRSLPLSPLPPTSLYPPPPPMLMMKKTPFLSVCLHSVMMTLTCFPLINTPTCRLSCWWGF